MITVNMVELWKVENSQEYLRMVEKNGYDRAQELVRSHLESRDAHYEKFPADFK